MMQAAETAGLTAMADALVAAGSVSREQASQMLAAEISAADGTAAPDTIGLGPANHGPGAAPSLLLRGGAGSGTASGNSASPGNSSADGHPTSADGLTSASGTPDQPDPASPPAPNPLAEIEIDPLFAPPATPEGYKLEMNPAVPITVEEVQAVRGWFHTLRLPQPKRIGLSGHDGVTCAGNCFYVQ